MSRPPLGFEYEIALAKIDTSVDLTFDEVPYPTILGDFVVVGCTKTIDCDPPVDQIKAIRCGYNPGAHLIPTGTLPGHLAFRGLDKATENTAIGYHGELCVARVTASIDNTVVRTMYCSYFTPQIRYQAPEGDDPGGLTGEGDFYLLSSA